MLDEIKEEPQGVAVVDLLRLEGILVLVRIAPKCVVNCYLDMWCLLKRVSLDEERAKRNPSDGSLLSVNDRGGILSFVKLFAKIARFWGCCST